MRISPSSYCRLSFFFLRSFVFFLFFYYGFFLSFFYTYTEFTVLYMRTKAKHSCRIVSVYGFIYNYGVSHTLRFWWSRAKDEKRRMLSTISPNAKEKSTSRLISVWYVRNGRYIDMYVYIHINTWWSVQVGTFCTYNHIIVNETIDSRILFILSLDCWRTCDESGAHTKSNQPYYILTCCWKYFVTKYMYISYTRIYIYIYLCIYAGAVFCTVKS